MIKLASYQILALLGSSLLVASGVMRFIQTASLKELFVVILYFIANIIFAFKGKINYEYICG